MHGKENEASFRFSILAESIDAIPDVEWSSTHVGSGSTFNLLFAYSMNMRSHLLHLGMPHLVELI
jgi:hypothetical protein